MSGLKETDIRIVNDNTLDWNGRVEDGTIKINLSDIHNENEFKGTLLHEVQHIIQKFEGFARGGSPREIYKKVYSIVENYLKINNSQNFVKLSENNKKIYIDYILRDILGLNKNGNIGMALYNLVLGEQEARNTKKRMDYFTFELYNDLPEILMPFDIVEKTNETAKEKMYREIARSLSQDLFNVAISGDILQKWLDRGEINTRYSNVSQKLQEEQIKQENYKSLLKDANKELAKVKESRDYWKHQTELTKSYTLDGKDTLKYTKELLANWDATLDANEVSKEIKKYGEYILGSNSF